MGETLCVELLDNEAPRWNGAERRDFRLEDGDATILLSRAG